MYNYVIIATLNDNTTNKLITQLVEEKYYPPTGNTYLISLYIDTYNRPRSDVYTVLNSYLKKGFSSRKTLKREDIKRDEVQEKIERKLNMMKSFNRGLGIFVKFSLENSDIDVKIYDSPIQVINDVFVGKVYKVDQIVWTSNLITNSLVISIERQESSICELKEDFFTELEGFTNEYIDPEAKEYQEKFSPVGDAKIVHGTGDIGKEREEKGENRRFFTDVYEAFKKSFPNLSEYEHVIVFHSDSYDPLVEEMEETFSNDYNIDLVFKSVQMDEVEDLEIESKKVIRNLKNEAKEEHLEISKSAQDVYAEGWKEVADASRFRKIDTLYVKKGLKKAGYISHDDLIYTYPVKDSEKVKDIAPWLFKNVLENSGKLTVFDEDSKKPNKSVAARLRF